MEINYTEPENLDELFSLLEEYHDSALIMAGGTDLLVKLKNNAISKDQVVHLKSVKEINKDVEILDRGLCIGAMTTLENITNSTLIRKRYPALAEAAGSVGSLQIRNKATLVGNICNASPAADTAPALLLYDANVIIKDCRGEMMVPLQSFFRGPNQTVLGCKELVYSINLPPPPEDSSSVYFKLARRRGADLATIGVASLVSRSGEVRIACGSVGPTPFRAIKVEQMLQGRIFDPEKIAQAIPTLLEAANPIDDIRASRAYRLAMLDVYVRRAIRKATEQVFGKGVFC